MDTGVGNFTMSLSTKLSPTATTSFQFKASFSPCLVFELIRNDIESIKEQLQFTVQKTPQFFNGSPVVIDLEKASALGVPDFRVIKSTLSQHGMIPIGIRSGTTEQQVAAIAADLPLVNIGKSNQSESPRKSQPTAASSGLKNPSKVINQQIRSGMQAYAKDSDLIVLAQVSPGAELMADGHIHVYGTLRGRALAGVHGNTEARIFCRNLEAELVAIAGFYLTREEISLLAIPEGNLIQIYLQDEQLRIEPL